MPVRPVMRCNAGIGALFSWGFGTTMLMLSTGEFAVFVDLVNRRMGELGDLNHLLQLADTEMKAAAFLRFFEPGAEG